MQPLYACLQRLCEPDQCFQSSDSIVFGVSIYLKRGFILLPNNNPGTQGTRVSPRFPGLRENGRTGERKNGTTAYPLHVLSCARGRAKIRHDCGHELLLKITCCVYVTNGAAQCTASVWQLYQHTVPTHTRLL